MTGVKTCQQLPYLETRFIAGPYTCEAAVLVRTSLRSVELGPKDSLSQVALLYKMG
jgi:hypothetical protein